LVFAAIVDTADGGPARSSVPVLEPSSSPIWNTSAADLKFLQQSRRGSFRNFKSKSGTRIINLLVPLCFRSSCQRVPQCITNFGSGALGSVHGLKAQVAIFCSWRRAAPLLGNVREHNRDPPVSYYRGVIWF